jgi:hypothetical protein
MTTVYIIPKGADFYDAKAMPQVELRDGGIWAKTPLGMLPFCDRTLLEAKGLDPVKVAKTGTAAQHPDCFLTLGINPGGTQVLTKEEYQAESSHRLKATMDAVHPHLFDLYQKYGTWEKADAVEDVYAADVLRKYQEQ